MASSWPEGGSRRSIRDSSGSVGASTWPEGDSRRSIYEILVGRYSVGTSSGPEGGSSG